MGGNIFTWGKQFSESMGADRAVAVGLALTVVCLMVLCVLVGVNLGVNQAQSQRSQTCADSSQFMERYCSQPAYFGTCFDTVSAVEDLLSLGSRDAIFARLAELEANGQSGAFSLWAVDESVEGSTSHNDLSTQAVVSTFDNPAYYYSRRVHVASLTCGGWSLGFWKTFPGANVTRSLQLAYCADLNQVRVCGAWNVVAQPE